MKEQPNKPVEFTARDAALQHIRPYVQRGDDIEYLKSSYMSSYNDRYHAQIGGYMISWYKLPNEKRTKLRSDQVGVSRVGKEEVHAIFPLPELYKEIEDENDPTKLRQGRLF